MILIVGGGPCGLFLGLALAHRDIPFVILEKREQRAADTWSRSIGIHPPSLAAFHEIGIAEPILAAGNRIVAGDLHLGPRKLATLNFSELNAPFPFVLTLPQTQTEAILEAQLEARAPGTLHRGCEVIALEGQTVHCQNGRHFTGDWIVACDGSKSRLRDLAGIPGTPTPYPGHYVMGDFREPDPPRQHRANIHICRDGLVERFPLPNGLARYVARLPDDQPITAEGLCTLLHHRIGRAPDPSTIQMLSPFHCERYLIPHMATDRLLFMGDAAHVTSPIGGQGMNLGWLDAAAFARIAIESNSWNWAVRRRTAASKAIRRAEMNMRLARPHRAALVPRALAITLKTPLRNQLMRHFTMMDLSS